MNLSDFDYHLPKELIAQEALPERGRARLLVYHRATQKISHHLFQDCLNQLNPGDLLVLNDTKVMPARFFGKKETGGVVEVLLLKEINGQIWEALLKPGRRIKKNQKVLFSNFTATVLDDPHENSGIRHLQFEAGIEVRREMERTGRIPLPPYIDREDSAVDRELYQTVFARIPGSVASPTAGLHFDQALLSKIEKKGIGIAYVTLHVGYGTFQPVAEENLAKHTMHEEHFSIPEETAEKINMVRSNGGRIVACGTTVTRTLESSATKAIPSEVLARRGSTNLFIYPPYEFKIVDAIITNFHLPRTTLLMLVAAFSGVEEMKQIYAEAIENRYRFYSYGDAMMIL